MKTNQPNLKNEQLCIDTVGAMIAALKIVYHANKPLMEAEASDPFIKYVREFVCSGESGLFKALKILEKGLENLHKGQLPEDERR